MAFAGFFVLSIQVDQLEQYIIIGILQQPLMTFVRLFWPSSTLAGLWRNFNVTTVFQMTIGQKNYKEDKQES